MWLFLGVLYHIFENILFKVKGVYCFELHQEATGHFHILLLMDKKKNVIHIQA